MLNNNSYIIDKVFNRFNEQFICEYRKDILGKKYKISEDIGVGEVLRISIENGLNIGLSEISSDNIFYMDDFDKEDILFVSFCIKGKHEIEYDKKYLVKNGDIIYFRPCNSFNSKYMNCKMISYFIDLKIFKKILIQENLEHEFLNWSKFEDNICKRDEIIIKKAPPFIQTYMSNIKNIELNNIVDYMKIKGCFLNYLTWFLDLRLNKISCLNKENEDLKNINKAKKIIIDNISEQIYVKDIADRLNISTYKLQTCFKKIEGTTVYDFIKKTKIENSKVYLEDTNLPIIEISQKIGYENPSKFSSTFKSITGLTPSRYRKVCKLGI